MRACRELRARANMGGRERWKIIKGIAFLAVRISSGCKIGRRGRPELEHVVAVFVEDGEEEIERVLSLW